MAFGFGFGIWLWLWLWLWHLALAFGFGFGFGFVAPQSVAVSVSVPFSLLSQSTQQAAQAAKDEQAAENEQYMNQLLDDLSKARQKTEIVAQAHDDLAFQLEQTRQVQAEQSVRLDYWLGTTKKRN